MEDGTTPALTICLIDLKGCHVALNVHIRNTNWRTRPEVLFLSECQGSGLTHPPTTRDVTRENHVTLNVTMWYPIRETSILGTSNGSHLDRKYKSSTPSQKSIIRYSYMQKFSLREVSHHLPSPYISHIAGVLNPIIGVQNMSLTRPMKDTEFLIISLGLTNAPSSFQRFINDIFKFPLGNFFFGIVDDILIRSCNYSDIILGILQQYKLFAKASKCKFGCQGN